MFNSPLTTASDMLTSARISMLFKHPFFAHLAMKLQLREVTEEQKASGFKTAAVDGRHLFYHEDFIKSLSKEENVFLVAHEVLHCAFMHIGARRFDRDPKLWNMANDYFINATLIEAGMTMPKIGLYERKYIGWSSDDIYDDLVKKGESGKPTLDHHEGDPGYPGKSGNQGGKGENKSSGKGKNKASGSENADQDESGSGITEEERKQLEEEWENNLVEAATAVGAGNVPAGIQRMIDDLLNPKLNWREFLQILLQSCVRSDYHWLKPNKRTFGSGITLPSMKMDDHVEIAVAIDTSGSVSEEMLKDFLSEVKGIMDSFSSYEIHIACFDAALHSPANFTSDDDITTYELAGGGGTNFMVWWNWAMQQEWYSNVQKVLFFTDGMPCGSWGPDEIDAPDTLWIVHGSENEGPFGHTVFYDDHKKGDN